MPVLMGIDIETYSSAPLPRCGVYRYCDAPDFEILLFSYAFDDEPIQTIDLASGDVLPQEVISALEDPSIIKVAYNAQFERVCLSRYLGHWLDPHQWRCTMVMAAYLTLPGRLADAAVALGTTEKKMEEGKDLIRYFSVPCKPTKTNGGRTRNLPADAPEKWAVYRQYNAQDVETERAIRKALEKFPLGAAEPSSGGDISEHLAGLEGGELFLAGQTAGGGPDKVVGSASHLPIPKPHRHVGKLQRLAAAGRVRFTIHCDAGGGASIAAVCFHLAVHRAAEAARCGQFRRAQLQSARPVCGSGCFPQELGGGNGSPLVAGDGPAQTGDGGIGAAAQRGCAAERGVGFFLHGEIPPSKNCPPHVSAADFVIRFFGHGDQFVRLVAGFLRGAAGDEVRGENVGVGLCLFGVERVGGAFAGLLGRAAEPVGGIAHRKQQRRMSGRL